MKKCLLATIVIVFVVPTIAFASWWNPTTWNISAWIFGSDTQVQTTNTITLPNQTPEQLSVFTEVATTSSTSVQVQTQSINSESCKTGSFLYEGFSKCMTPLAYCKNQDGSRATYNSANNSCGCADGYKLNSNGICTIKKTGYEICAGINATWDGISYMDNGTYNCLCKAGYTQSSDQKSCVVAQSTQNQHQTDCFANTCPVGDYSAPCVAANFRAEACVQQQLERQTVQFQTPLIDPVIIPQQTLNSDTKINVTNCQPTGGNGVVIFDCNGKKIDVTNCQPTGGNGVVIFDCKLQYRK